MFHTRVTMSELARLSRNLGVSLNSGVNIVKAFELASRKTTGRLQSVLFDVLRELKSGSDVASALSAHKNFFPPLFLGLVQMGEQTGNLPEILKAAADHYENNIRLKREFISQITMPVVQFVAAIFIIAGLICLLGWIGESTGHTVDVLGWGLLGTRGALLWLGGWAMLLIAIVIGYQVLSASLSGKQAIHRFLNSLPVLGNCLQSFAIARFSWAFYLTQESGMPIEDSLKSSLKATSNGAFIAAGPEMISGILAGQTLTETFQKSGLFPVEFMEYVLVAEQSGTVPEALHRMSPQFEEDARRSLQALAATLSWVIWALVALFIIFVVFTIALWYISLINDALSDI